MFKFIKVGRAKNRRVNYCLKCCFNGVLFECARNKCFPYQREDERRGYFVKVDERSSK